MGSVGEASYKIIQRGDLSAGFELESDRIGQSGANNIFKRVASAQLSPARAQFLLLSFSGILGRLRFLPEYG